MKLARIYVDEEFKKKLKKDALELNMSVLQYTEKLAKDEPFKKTWTKTGFKL